MTASHLSGLDPHKPYMLRVFGEDDSAWQLVRPPARVEHRPVKMPSDTPGEPDKNAWLDTVTVDLADGGVRIFNWSDDVEVRVP
jgi:hypothetical protein